METYSLRVAERLPAYGQTQVIALPGNDDGSIPKPGALIRFGLATAVKLLFARNPADVTHVADMASWPLALAARIRRPGAKRTLSAHGTDVAYAFRGGVKGKAYGTWLRLGALCLGRVQVVANSNATADATRHFGFKDIDVVPLATDLRPPKAVSPSRTIFFSGRLVRRKGCAWFIRNVLPNLPEDVRLTVAGTKWDADEVAALDHPRVEFLGHLPFEDLPARYANAACVIVPNIDVPAREFEGFGLVAVEAAASGGVVLAADHSGLKEAVIEGETGFKLPTGDADAWVRKITEVLEWSNETRQAFTENAAQKAAAVYDWDRVTADTFKAYGVSP